MPTPIHWLSTQRSQITQLETLLENARERYGYTVEEGSLIEHPIGEAQSRAVDILKTAVDAMTDSCDVLEAELAVIDDKEVN